MASFLLPSSLFLLLLFLLLSTPAASWLPKKPPPPSSGEAPLPCSKTRAERLEFQPKSSIAFLGKAAMTMADQDRAKKLKQVNGKPMPPIEIFVFREVMSAHCIWCADDKRMMSYKFEIQVRMGFEDGVLHASLVVDPSGGFRLGPWMFVTA